VTAPVPPQPEQGGGFQGWGWPGNSRKAHYFPFGETRSLCGRWVFSGHLSDDYHDSPDNCTECKRKRAKLWISPLFAGGPTLEVPEGQAERKATVSREFMRAADRLPTMWVLSQEWDRLLNMLEDPEADAPADIERVLDELAGNIAAKGHGLAVVMQQLEHLAEWQRSEAKRLTEKARANEAHVERVRAYTLAAMKSLGVARLETGRFTLAVRQNPAHVEIDNEPVLARVEAYETMPDVPPEFVRLITLYKVDKRAILAAVKATGEIPPGVTVERGESLRIS
jgi:hypothetical protein